MIFSLGKSLFRSVLPAVGVLQLEVGVARQLAIVQGDAVVLTYIAIRAYTRGVLQHSPFLTMLLRDDIDYARYGIRAIEGARSSLHNLYLLYVMRVDEREVVLATVVAVQPPAVNQYQYIRVAQSVHLQARAHVVLAEVEAGSQSGKNVFDALA